MQNTEAPRGVESSRGVFISETEKGKGNPGAEMCRSCGTVFHEKVRRDTEYMAGTPSPAQRDTVPPAPHRGI